VRSAAARLAILATAAAASPAIACDCVSLIPGSPRFEADLNAIAAHYPVAAEGVLEKHGYDWRFRPIREYRGPKRPFYLVTLMSDCSLAPDELDRLVGKPVFLLLSEGQGPYDGRYEAGRCVNLLGEDIDRAIRTRIDGDCRER
jgi:hypothetical protein